MPMIPEATARIASLDSLANSWPRSMPKMRSKISVIARAPDVQCLGRQLADLGLHAADQRRQIVVRLRPCRMHLLADDRPAGNLFGRRRNLEPMVAHVLDQVLDRIAELAGQHDGRRDDHADDEQDDKGRGESLLVTDPGG